MREFINLQLWFTFSCFHFKTVTDADPLYVVEVLLHCSKDSVKDAATEAAKPVARGETGEMQVGQETA